MRKIKEQRNEQFICYEVTNTTINKIKPLLQLATTKANKLIANDEVALQMIECSVFQMPYNNGYIDDRFIFSDIENFKELVFLNLHESFNYTNDLLAWELYLDNQILISCNHPMSIININKILLIKNK